MSYEDIDSKVTIKKYGILIPPAIIFDDHVLTEGHVPIMKKLALELQKIIKQTK